MEVLSASMLQSLNTEKKRRFEELLPLIIKKLIIAGNNDVTKIRIPSGNDIWASGFDGIVECEIGNTYIAEGLSVWEFGTSNDSLAKINSDYDKRTNDSLGIDKCYATFYLVIPKIWKYSDEISEWEASHKDWKKVCVYDASILCDWINSEPTVCSWLLETIFEKELDFCGIEKAWERFSQKVNPPFVYEMFIDRRENIIETLEQKLNQEIVTVKSDSFIDSMGFVLGALSSQKEYREKCIVVFNEKTYKDISCLVHKKIIVLAYTCNHDLLPANNCVISCYNKEAVSLRPDIMLNSYTRLHYLQTFRKMGIDDGKAGELYAFCHGNLPALIRRIPGCANDYVPGWASINNKQFIEPIIFLRSIDTNVDKEIVEKIAGGSFKEIDEFYRLLLQKEDTPIKRVENNYLLINYEEAWRVLAYGESETVFERFHNSVKWFIGSIIKDGYYSGNYGQPRHIKKHIRNLMLNYVYFSFSEIIGERIYNAIKELLNYTSEERVKELIVDNLAILAEASPEAVAGFIENDLKNEKSIVMKLFENVDYSHEYTGVLGALDELTLHKKTVNRACKVLFSLYQKDYKYTISNSPEESLLTALCLVNSDVAVTIHQKIDLIRYFYRMDKLQTSKLICKLLGKYSFWRSVRYGEHHNDVQDGVTMQEVINSTEIIAEMAFQYCISNGDIPILQALLKQYQRLKPDFLEKIINDNNFEKYKDKEIEKIVFQLRESIYLIQKYNFEDKEVYLPILKSWAGVLTDVCDEEKQDVWMFIKTYDCPSEEILKFKDDFEAEREAIQQLRCKKLREIYETKGSTGIIAIVAYLENYAYWGYLLINVLTKESYMELSNVIASMEKYALLAGMIDAADDDCAKYIYSIIPKESHIQVLNLVSRSGFWKELQSEEEKKAFWNNQILRDYDSEIFGQLLRYNPKGLLLYIYQMMQKDPLVYFEQAIQLMNSLEQDDAINGSHLAHDKFEIATIVSCIDNCHYSEEWAMTAIKLYQKGYLENLSESSRKYYFYNPDELLNVLSSNSKTFYAELYDFTLPALACNEYEKLVFFVNSFIKADKKYLAGQMVGKIQSGDDGKRICDTVRELLEDVDDVEFDNSVISGIINSSGVRTVQDGEDQKVLAEKYSNDASELELFYPHAAYVLQELSKLYSNEGRRDYIYSELSDY